MRKINKFFWLREKKKNLAVYMNRYKNDKNYAYLTIIYNDVNTSHVHLF